MRLKTAFSPCVVAVWVALDRNNGWSQYSKKALRCPRPHALKFNRVGSASGAVSERATQAGKPQHADTNVAIQMRVTN